MNKDITEDILLRVGFNKEKCYSITYSYRYIKILSDVYVEVYDISNMPTRNWNVRVCDFNGIKFADVDIQTIEHFNKLMDLMDIDFKLKEE